MTKYSLIILGAIASSAHAGPDDLAKAVKSLTAADSYAFVAKGGNPGDGVEGQYQKDKPLHVKADKMEFFRKGDLMVYKKDDAWHRTRTGTLSDPLIILGASAKVRDVRIPHEEIAALGKALSDVEKADATLTGKLTEAASRDLVPKADANLARGGKATIWLDAQGRATKYEFTVQLKGQRGNADVDGAYTKTVTLSGLGATRLDVPEAATMALNKN
jgi:hypothetical protein